MYDLGDRVIIEAGVPCGQPTCEQCRSGRYNGCPHIVFFSSPPHHGTLQRYHVHSENWLHRLPDKLTFEEGALVEPFSVALYGINLSGLRLADPIVIFGAGPVGLLTLLAAHAAGAVPISIVDLDDNRLQFAKKVLPRVHLIKPSKNDEPKKIAEQVKAATHEEAKIVFECTGVEQSLQSAIYVSRPALIWFYSC